MPAIWNPFWRLIADRLPAPLVYVDHQHCRHCKLPLRLSLSQLSLTVIARKMYLAPWNNVSVIAADVNQEFPWKKCTVYHCSITQSNGKIGQLAGLQEIALFLDDLNISSSMKTLYWSYTIGATYIEFDGIPFSVGGEMNTWLSAWWWVFQA